VGIKGRGKLLEFESRAQQELTTARILFFFFYTLASQVRSLGYCVEVFYVRKAIFL